MMLAMIVLAALASTPAMAVDGPEVHQQNDISYVSGGIGDEEQARLEAVKKDYNLHVMNADKIGHFTGDIRIVITDLEHNTLVDATGGPIFYANLPNGRYIVEGFSPKLSKKETITIAAGKPAHVRFLWPQDAAK